MAIDTVFVMAAGRGERLRPLTDDIPKPILPLGSTTLIENNLEAIEKAGIKRVIINVWHLADKIIEKLGDGKKYNLKIQYSREKELLGTGGGLKNAYSLIDREIFLLMNSDIITSLDINSVINSFNNSSALMVVRPLGMEKHTPILVENNKVMKIGKGTHQYLGVAIITKEVVDELPDTYPSCLIRNSIVPLINKGKDVSAYVFDGYWRDAGTKNDYDKVCSEFGVNL